MTDYLFYLIKIRKKTSSKTAKQNVSSDSAPINTSMVKSYDYYNMNILFSYLRL
jgi:hypothetical protein